MGVCACVCENFLKQTMMWYRDEYFFNQKSYTQHATHDNDVVDVEAALLKRILTCTCLYLGRLRLRTARPLALLLLYGAELQQPSGRGSTIELESVSVTSANSQTDPLPHPGQDGRFRFPRRQHLRGVSTRCLSRRCVDGSRPLPHHVVPPGRM